jgi:hypothetical protein
VKDYLILAPPRIHELTFATILKDAGSPVASVARAAWDGIVLYDVDPALALAIFQHESGYGRNGAATTHRNWGNLRTSPGFPSSKGFVLYPTWAAGAKDAARLLSVYGRNRIRYSKKKKRWRVTGTARTFPFVWAPSADGNRPTAYGDAIVRKVNEYIAIDRRLHPTASPPHTTPHPTTPPGHPPATPPAVPAHPAAMHVDGYRASFDRVRIRVGPTLTSRIVRVVNHGFAVGVDGMVMGSHYDAPGGGSRTWARIVTIEGKPVNPPVFSAEALWRHV